MTNPDSSRRRFLTTALSAGVGAVGLAACGNGPAATAPLTTTPSAPGPVASGPVSGTPSVTPAAVLQVEPPVTTGEQALRRLLEGNARFVADRTEAIDEGVERRVAVSKSQQPFATVLGCVDSRVPVELVFDRGLGDLVVVRSAGEALDHSVTGSLEFGVAELHTPLLMVLGHQRCGALDATIKALDSHRTTAHAGQIDYLVETLAPAVRQVSGKPGDRLDNAVRANVGLVIAQLRKSPVLGPLEKSGKLTLVAAYYELDTGKVVVSG
ncbi:carbonic anhydrase [Kribbella flavida DSM 17836]|uniref:Carbonic anhydrase n=1 Tax=Kribbella flavida (strain DSM 17836 / JCM 10339 / NBRC 14399) TaxID=479435 RepID=D2PLS5_KRIFD|nr:carbonic anhydrase [Kribbella flavida]ADB32505.1 carbonic anhydrase [Kribbella flavida DSM 17836]